MNTIKHNFGYVGNVEVQLVNKHTGEIERTERGNNAVTLLWRERLSAFLGGFGGVGTNEIRPNEIVGYSNTFAAEFGTSSFSSSVVGVTSSGLTGSVYFDNGALDISYLGQGATVYKGDFSPGEDGQTTTSYIIRSMRLATDAGSTTIGQWGYDAYAPVATLVVSRSLPGFANGEIVVSPSQILIIRWTLICGQSSSTDNIVTTGTPPRTIPPETFDDNTPVTNTNGRKGNKFI